MEILLFHKGGIGDVVFGLPLLADLRRGFSRARVTVLTHTQGKEVLDLCPLVDEVIAAGDMADGWTLGQARAALEGKHFDVGMTTVRSLRAAWLLRSIGARQRVGFGGGPERVLYTHVAPVKPFEVVFSRRFERLAIALNLETDDASAQQLLRIPSELQERAREQLRTAGWDGRARLIALHVGGGWVTKQWPTEHLTAFVRLAADKLGAQVLLQGGAADRARAEEVQAVAGAFTVPILGNPIREAIAQTSLCTAVVGMDSGLSHAGAALGLPTVFLFGPNDPHSVVPRANQKLLYRKELECRPCNRKGKNGCPLGHHKCMRDITAEDVLAALQKLMARV